jgi:transcriptional regulator with XRE-family HTH domain
MIGHDVTYARICNSFLAFSKNRWHHHVSYMPRPYKKKSPIRDLRTIIGKSQRNFAHSLGISPSALKRIENNDLALSRRVARKIEIEAGVDRQSLLRGTLRTIEKQEYTARWYEAWKENHSWQSEEVAKVIASRLEPLLVAAAGASTKRMWQVLSEILETLDRCRTDFKLERAIDQILAKQRPPMKWDVLKPPLEWEKKEAIATRRPRPSSVRRRKA